MCRIRLFFIHLKVGFVSSLPIYALFPHHDSDAPAKVQKKDRLWIDGRAIKAFSLKEA